MAEFPIHEVSYDPELREQATRELLHLSQTNITPNPEEGLPFAVAAFDKAIAEFQEGPRTDPTAAGEAAAKAALRSEQLDLPEEADKWFNFSYHALNDAESEIFYRAPYIRRERAATQLLHGRTLGLRATKSEQPRHDLVEQASILFGLAERELWSQHMTHGILGGRWDRYATMLSGHRAANESRNPESTRRHVVGIAAVGAWRAVRAKCENVSEPTPADAKKEHRRFVAKHVGVNALAGALGLAQPRRDGTRYDRLHKKLVGKILG